MKPGNLIIGLILVVVGGLIAVNGNNQITSATACSNSFFCLIGNSVNGGSGLQSTYNTGITEIAIGVVVGIVGLVMIATAFQGGPNVPIAQPEPSATAPTSRFCSNCGSSVRAGARFCDKCGAQV